MTDPWTKRWRRRFGRYRLTVTLERAHQPDPRPPLERLEASLHEQYLAGRMPLERMEELLERGLARWS